MPTWTTPPTLSPGGDLPAADWNIAVGDLKYLKTRVDKLEAANEVGRMTATGPGQTVPNAAWTKVVTLHPTGANDFLVGGMTTTDWQIVVTEGGYYTVSASIEFAAAAGYAGTFAVAIGIGGGVYENVQNGAYFPSTSIPVVCSVTDTIFIAAHVGVSLWAWQTTGITYGLRNTTLSNHLSVVKVG